MIFRCDCGTLKTDQPFRCAGQMPWLCPKCAPAKRSVAASREAQQANGGRAYPSQPEARKTYA